MSNTIIAVDLLKKSLDTFLSKDMKAWSELCDENVVIEFPFASEGSPTRIEGRAAIYDFLKNYPNFIDLKSRPTLQIYSTTNPNQAIAEWSASGKVISTGNPYEMSYISFVTFKDGLIVNYREYWNPLDFQKAMSGVSFSS